MAYEIIATDPDDGTTLAELTTKVTHSAAHMLMGALGIYYESDDEEGSGDVFTFTDAELSAAEEALVLADGSLPPEEVKEGIAKAQAFLSTVREWTRNEALRTEVEQKYISVEIGFF